MPGVGTTPIGTGPFGVGMPLPSTPAPTRIMVGDNGAQYGSRKISTDPATAGQYVFDTDGNPVGDKDARQLVTLAIMTELDSSCVRGLGRDRRPDKIGPNLDAQQRASVTSALSGLVKRGIIAINSITTIDSYGGRVFTRVEVTDLTTNQPITVQI